jgi:hypothetical protein
VSGNSWTPILLFAKQVRFRLITKPRSAKRDGLSYKLLDRTINNLLAALHSNEFLGAIRAPGRLRHSPLLSILSPCLRLGLYYRQCAP